MQRPDLKKITTDNIEHPLLKSRNVRADVLRLDKIHPVISGNKWFKLKYHLDNFNAGKYKGIITFGGAWSNHIVAAACICYIQKIKCVGIIRGQKPQQLSYTLQQAINYGMELKFISRKEYQTKSDQSFIGELLAEFPGYYIIPEGGAGETGQKGAGEILQYTGGNKYTHIACAVGTATMYNGIHKSLAPGKNLMGVVVLKGWKEKTKNENDDLLLNYYFGGYAKYTSELLSFMNEFYAATGIPTDFVYTGKLAFAIFDLIKNNYFLPGSSILMIHSGGLQGNQSLQKGSLIF